MKILNGKELAAKVKDEVRAEVAELAAAGTVVHLAVVVVGEDPASAVYVRNKEKACEYCGIKSTVYRLSSDVTEGELLEMIGALNEDDEVHGILVQLPLPESIDEDAVINRISPAKDVDGFNEINVGKLTIGDRSGFVPCTTRGIIELLKANGVNLEGKDCVVVGRSNIVGKPTALELLRENATVTICHSKTRNLKYICRDADILICAVGKPKFFNRKYITPGTVIIDVGIHRDADGKLCGDVDYEDIAGDCGYELGAITPVPGGVGPMTVAMLMRNVTDAAKRKVDI